MYKTFKKKTFEKFKRDCRSSYICSEKCYGSVSAFHNSDDIDLFSGIFGEGLYPCVKCKRDCVDQMACIQCSVCDVWCHHICSSLSNDEFLHRKYFFCGSKCENVNIKFLPFHDFRDDELLKHSIFEKCKLTAEQIGAKQKKKARRAKK